MRVDENRAVPFFAGEFSHSLDPKNRVSIPAAWRRGEKTEFFVVPSSNHESLLAFPPVEFRGVSESVLSDASLAPRDKQTFCASSTPRRGSVRSTRRAACSSLRR